MQRRKQRSPVSARFARRGHRSHVAGVRRFLAGKKKSWIGDALHADATAMMRRIRRAQERRA